MKSGRRLQAGWGTRGPELAWQLGPPPHVSNPGKMTRGPHTQRKEGGGPVELGKLRAGWREPPSSSRADGPPGGRKGPTGAAQRPRPPGETPLRKQETGPLLLCANISIPETRWPPARARGWGRPSHFSCLPGRVGQFRVRSRRGVSEIRGQALLRTQPGQGGKDLSAVNTLFLCRPVPSTRMPGFPIAPAGQCQGK